MRVLKKAYMRPTDWKKNYVRYRSYFLDIAGRYKERTDIRVYLEILLSLTTISIFSIFALRPTLLTIGGLIKDIEAKKATLVKMDEKMKNLSQAQNLYDQEREKIRRELNLKESLNRLSKDELTGIILSFSNKYNDLKDFVTLKTNSPEKIFSSGYLNRILYQIKKELKQQGWPDSLISKYL